MSKISEIAKRYKAEAESAKKADYDSRYGAHYNSVMLPHLRELDETFNKTVNEMKAKLDEEKASYITAQKAAIEEQVNAEYTAFFSSISSFIDKEG